MNVFNDNNENIVLTRWMWELVCLLSSQKLDPIERPSSAKHNQPLVDPFRTTIFKKDYVQKQQQLEQKNKKPSGLQNM